MGFMSDPVVLFDKGNSRWVITYHAHSGSRAETATPPFLQCFAVSTTSDATGTYYLYAADLTKLGGAAGALNDYGMMGIWPDAYYMSFNEGGYPGLGASPCAFPSSEMIAGISAQAICFPPIPTEHFLLPADRDGASGPFAGEPEFFLSTLHTSDRSSSLHLWKFHVDFATPAKSTFSGEPTILQIDGYALPCDKCISQPTIARARYLPTAKLRSSIREETT
jgi:hypothetical protein